MTAVQNPRAGRLFYGLALAVLIGFVAWVGRGILIPVVFAGFLSFFIFTLKQTIKRGPLIGRYLPNWLCYVFAFAVIGLVFLFIIDIVRDNVETLIGKAGEYETRLRDLSSEGIAFLHRLQILPEDFMGGLDELRGRALGLIQPLIAEAGKALRAVTANIVTIVLYTVFMLLERGRIFTKIGLLSDSARERRAIDEIIVDIGAMVRGYVTIKTVMNLTTAALGYAIMRILGVEFAGFWALLIFLLNYIPIVGSISAIAAISLSTLVQPAGGGPTTAALAFALLVAADQLMSSAVEPRLMGKSLNLSPLVILLSLSVWGSLWGFAGALLAVPMTVTVMIILTQFLSTRPIAILMSDSGKIAAIKHPASANLAGDPSPP